MDKYELLTQIGDGTFGSVAKAVLKKTGQLVAIKKMKQKFYTWEECVKLPEVDVVRRIHGHPNVVKLREVIRENNELFFVFEFMDGDLLGVIKKSKLNTIAGSGQSSPYIPYAQIKSFMRQMLQALAYIHKRGYFHRDLKPENLLIRKEPSGEEVLKLADFGLVKEIRARPPFTDYVSTRWYRAPELLLQDRFYSSPVDIWAAGCIMAELITTRPLFPGSNEVDQLFKIMSVLGAPTEKKWAGGIHLAKKIRYTFPTIAGSGLAQVLPSHTPAAAMDLMAQMLTYDPKLRPTADQCLHHPFFTTGADEGGEPSAAVVDQLALATKRLQPGPQSAPPPLKGSSLLEALAAQKAGRATADGTLGESSPHKPFALGRPAETTPALKPLAGVSSATFPGAAGGLEGLPESAGETASKEAGVLPPLQPHASPMKRRSQEASGTSLAKKLAGLKNVHVGNGNGKAARAAPSASTSASPSATPTLPATGSHDSRPPRMKVAQPIRRRISKEAETTPPPPAVTLAVPPRDVNLDELMEEFASEMSHRSASAEDGAAETPLTQDSVAALLSSSRFKKTASVTNESTSLQPLKTSGPTRTAFLSKQRKSGDSNAVPELPRVEHATKGVSPSLKALLAKHKTSTFAYQ